MILEVSPLPFEEVRGIYTIRGHKNRMPDRALFLEPEAARSYLALADVLTVSDVYRSPEASLLACRTKEGAKPPGWSAHNFGLAIDIDVEATMLATNMKTKGALDAFLKPFGWFCHRLDGRRGFEAWHYNFLGPEWKAPATATRSDWAIEEKILRKHRAWFQMENRIAQACLKDLKMYGGALDGLIGPLSREAIRVFQRAWQHKYMKVTGELDAPTKRTLAVVTAVKQVTYAK